MTKPARCTDPRRAQRGDALLEALVGILLLALLGLGLSHAAARMLAAQRYAAAHGIVNAQMRNALETQGIAHLCSNPHTFSITPAGGSAVSVELPAAHCEKHDVAISTGERRRCRSRCRRPPTRAWSFPRRTPAAPVNCWAPAASP